MCAGRPPGRPAHDTTLRASGNYAESTKGRWRLRVRRRAAALRAADQHGLLRRDGRVEEKSTRVVEVVLSTLRPRHLLAGEIHGLGLLGLAQLLLLALVGIGTAAAAGALEVNRDVLVAALLALAWFVVGYAFYAAAFGCAAAARVAPGRPAVGDLAADDRADGRLLHLVRRARGPRRHAGGDGDEAARGLARGRAPRPAGPAAARRRRWRRRSARRPPRGGCAPARPCPRGSCARRRSRRPRSSAAT